MNCSYLASMYLISFIPWSNLTYILLCEPSAVIPACAEPIPAPNLLMERYPAPPHRSRQTVTVLFKCQEDIGLIAQHMRTTLEKNVNKKNYFMIRLINVSEYFIVQYHYTLQKKSMILYILVLRSIFWLESPFSLNHVEAERECISIGLESKVEHAHGINY